MLTITSGKSRYFAEICFKGTAYCGWQIQPGSSTIQELIENRFSTYLREAVTVTGCGRTDTGVHARQFFLHFEATHPGLHQSDFLRRINRFLPPDVVLRRLFPVPGDFHARFSALSRTYQYQVSTLPDPFLLDYAWFLHLPLDLEQMNQAAQILLRHADFTSFSKVSTDVKNHLCRVTHALWTRQDHLLVFEIRSNRFLRNMVRAIVGTLVEVGKGKISLGEFDAIILKKDRSSAGQSVPAQGLFLTEVDYGFDNLDWYRTMNTHF